MSRPDPSEAATVRARLRLYAGRADVRAQALFLIVAGALIWMLAETASDNLARSGADAGYSFLWDKASFELGESLIAFGAGDTYARAFLVGVLNTVKVAVVAILLSTVVGLVVALGQLSPSGVVARLCRGYVEVARSVPLLLQLIFWHTFLLRGLPTVRQALSPVEGVYLTNRGLYLPAPLADPAHGAMGWALIGGAALAAAILFAGRRMGGRLRAGRWAAAALILPPLAVFLAMGAPLAMESPALKGFNFAGGITVSPEFAAMALGLTLYHGAFNAEIIRAGILGVPKGQAEAGVSLGLGRGRVMRMIVIPQALRIIIPPMTNSYLSLTKESSLAVAIGYPELVRVANITLAETNQSIECISIIMVLYLILSLVTSAILNVFNARAAREER